VLAVGVEVVQQNREPLERTLAVLVGVEVPDPCKFSTHLTYQIP